MTGGGGALGCHKIVRIFSGDCALTRYKVATCQEIKGRTKGEVSTEGAKIPNVALGRAFVFSASILSILRRRPDKLRS